MLMGKSSTPLEGIIAIPPYRRRRRLLFCCVNSLLLRSSCCTAFHAKAYSTVLSTRTALQFDKRKASCVYALGGSEATSTLSTKVLTADGRITTTGFPTCSLQTLTTSLDALYTHSSNSIRCPFFRRRAADTIDSIAMILRFLLIRHKSLGFLWESVDESSDEASWNKLLLPPGCKAVGRHVCTDADGSVVKVQTLNLPALLEIIRLDWKSNNHKGYYITGRLNSTVYRDDCLFDGPDPDMPVRGLRKYLAAASHLFDANHSFAQLLSLHIEHSPKGRYGQGVIVAKWKLGGVLMLPWRPVVKPWTGLTRYHVDKEGLIGFHEEEWDISVWEAFVCTVFPTIGNMLWCNDDDDGKNGLLP